jgi:predicted permease
MHDLHLALRQLRRRPIFTLTAVLTLAIGIGVNAVAFTVVSGVLWRGSATAALDGVGRIATTPGGDEGGYASLEEYRRFGEGTRGALDVAAEGRSSLGWRHDGITDTAWVLFVSPTYFSMVDVEPIVGRLEVAAAANGPASVVIGERFWRKKLNAAPLAGLTLRLNDADVAVAGVLPDAYTGPAGLYSPDVWLPLDDLARFGTPASLQARDTRWLFVMGRLRPGVSAAEAQARVEAAAAAMAHDWPDSHAQRGARYRLLGEGNSELHGIATASALAMGVIALVLLLACFNVANLLLARAVERERDMGIRSALGASAWRLVRLVMTEGFAIAALAGLAALVVAAWTQSLVGAFAIPIEEPQHIDLRPDATVVGFIVLLVCVAGILPGLWPALAAARADVSRILGAQRSSAGGRPTRTRRWLVAAQIAGSTLFLAIAGLFAQSYGNLASADLGFARDHLLVAEADAPAGGYTADRAERYVDALAARVRALPGVERVAVASRAPFFIGYQQLAAVAPAGAACAAADCPTFATMGVGPGYFRAMDIPLTAGREFEAERRDEAIINQPLAQRLWPDGRGGVGEIVRIGPSLRPARVVGVSAKAHVRGLDREAPTLYVPLTSNDFAASVSLVVRTTPPPDTLVRPIIAAARDVDANVPLVSVKTMAERMAVQLWPFRTVSWLFWICGVLALVLSTVGLAAVVIHAVNRRQMEFGVRISVGATPRHIASDVLRGSAGLLLPGLVVGILIAAIAARLVRVAFVGVNVLDPGTYLVVAALEAAVVLAASLGPALRASRVDPLVALRAE